MHVTGITVSFLREKQPAKFEKAQPSVEMSAVLDEGENHLSAARDLMLDAASVVYAGIGYAIPDKVAAALANVAPGVTIVTGEGVKAEVKVEEKKAEDITADNFPGKDEAKAEEKPAAKKRGRPKGSTNKPSNTKKPAEEAVPGDDDSPTSAGSADAPAQPNGVATSAEQDQADEPFTAQDLEKMFQDEMGRPVAQRRITMPRAKAIIHFFGVSRAVHIPEDKVLEAKALVLAEFTAFEAEAVEQAAADADAGTEQGADIP